MVFLLHWEMKSCTFSASTGNRVYRKFPLIRKMEDGDQPIPFLKYHHEMQRRSKSPEIGDDDNNYNNDWPKYDKNGRFFDSNEHFWPPGEVDGRSLMLDEVENNPNTGLMNDITDKVKNRCLEIYEVWLQPLLSFCVRSSTEPYGFKNASWNSFFKKFEAQDKVVYFGPYFLINWMIYLDSIPGKEERSRGIMWYFQDT